MLMATGGSDDRKRLMRPQSLKLWLIKNSIPGPQLTVGEKRVTEGQRGTGQAAARLQGPAPPQCQLSLQSLRIQPAR